METVNHNASRADVESSFTEFAQLIHASLRPLPTQTGDGAYLDHAEPTGLFADIKVCFSYDLIMTGHRLELSGLRKRLSMICFTIPEQAMHHAEQ